MDMSLGLIEKVPGKDAAKQSELNMTGIKTQAGLHLLKLKVCCDLIQNGVSPFSSLVEE